MGPFFVLSLKNWTGGDCHGMKYLEYRPDMEDTHFADLNAMDDQLPTGDTPNFSDNDFGSVDMSVDPVDVSQSVQPSSGNGSLASWQVVPESDQGGSGLDNAVEMLGEQQNASQVDAGISAESFDSLLEQAHISNLLASQNNSLPWEMGVHAAIFSDTWDVLQHHNLGVVIPPELPEVMAPEPENPVTAALERMKRKSLASICDKVTKALPDRNFQQIRTELWNKALNKLLLVFTLACFPGDLGTRVWTKFVVEQQSEQAKEILRDVLGNKSPNTVNKRYNSMLALIDWLHAREVFSWPLQVVSVLDFMNAEPRGKKVLSRGKALLGAMRFFRFVMQFEQLDIIINDPQLLGRSKRLDGMKTEIHQARPLKLSEVRQMENFMIGDSPTRDKYLMGCALFVLYSRSRWSDIAYVEYLELDSSEVDGKPFGFVESSTRHQKTGTSALKKATQMPLVCPVLGVSEVEWAHIWMETVMSMGLDLFQTPFGPICRAPRSDGSLSTRSVTSEEISDFLNSALELEGDKCVTSHSLKRTTLAWASKYGLPEPTRAMLGHHEIPGQSMACYSRDLLARPLSQYQSMLMNIRHGFFLPDATRSGRFIAGDPSKSVAEDYSQMVETAKPWPSVRKAARTVVSEGRASNAGTSVADGEEGSELPPLSVFEGHDVTFDVEQPGLDKAAIGGLACEEENEKEDSVEDSSSSSDDESSSSSVNAEELHSKINGDCYVKHTSERCFQNRKTKMLHRPGKAEGLLLCGRRCNDNYLELQDGASFHWPRCTACYRGEVLTTAEQLVEAFDKVKAARAR